MTVSQPRIGLVACASKKASEPTEARYLYTSPLFRAASTYVSNTCDRWFILSAKHGLVLPDQVIEPYDLTLKDVGQSGRRAWRDRVLAHLRELGLFGKNAIAATFELHAGEHYRRQLERPLRATTPLQFMRIGEQLQWYAQREREFAGVER